MSFRRLKMNCRRIPLFIFIFIIITIVIMYMVFFKHGSPEKILAANDRQNKYLDKVLAGSADADSEVVESARKWQRFMTSHKYVSIGDIYNECEGDERMWLGKVALMKDKLRGGVTSKTFVNVTFGLNLRRKWNSRGIFTKPGVVCSSKFEGYFSHPGQRNPSICTRSEISLSRTPRAYLEPLDVTTNKELTVGEFHLSVKYGGKELYENKWEFCTMEEEENDEDEERYIFCPYKAKEYSWTIERKIPNFLPKGKYYAKAWLLDDDDELIMCAEAEFVL